MTRELDRVNATMFMVCVVKADRRVKPTVLALETINFSTTGTDYNVLAFLRSVHFKV